MSFNLQWYRITPDDLPDADKKTQRALGPLLEALNRALTNIIQVLNTLTLPLPKASAFTTDAAGGAQIDLKLTSTPTELWVSSLVPTQGAISAVYASSWIPLTAGARLLFVGLAASTTYSLKVRYL